jgi:sugar phosphate isomerase/epimerase
MGFDGVDLTVRPAGHALPERAAGDLPRAVAAIRSHGLAVPMITTGILSAADPAPRPILTAAGKLGIRYYKPGYWIYKGPDVEQLVAQVTRDLAGITAIGKACGVEAGVHNHSGDHFGCAMWDIREALRGLEPRWAGYYFDPGHATAEGGVNGWLVATHLALARLKMVALKDFYVEKAGGKWRLQWCPLGQGMVDWDRFLPLLAASRFSGPVSLHIEYKPKDLPAAIAADLEFIRGRMARAYAR